MFQTGKDGDNKVYTYIEDDGTLKSQTIKEGDKITVDGKEKDFKASVATKEVTTVKDSPLSFWNQTLVVEDGNYINTAIADHVDDWINQQISQKS